MLNRLIQLLLHSMCVFTVCLLRSLLRPHPQCVFIVTAIDSCILIHDIKVFWGGLLTPVFDMGKKFLYSIHNLTLKILCHNNKLQTFSIYSNMLQKQFYCISLSISCVRYPSWYINPKYCKSK